MRSHLALIVFLFCAACDSEPPTAAELASALAVPPGLEVPAGNHVVASYRAFGFQVYECQASLTWAFRAPAALLVGDDDALVAVHFGGIDVGLPAGPYWQSTLDGSRVHAGNAISAPSPGAIPLLRLQALDRAGAGLLADVTYLHRLETTGGVGPTGSCRRAGLRSFVPYTATYVFWAASLPRPAVPDTIAVPEGNDVAYAGHATGVQIYECAADATWKLRAPRALLTDLAGDFAEHFGGIDAGLPAGPYWQSLRDGSRVHGGNAVSAPSPGTIALLRLQALDNAGNGVMSRVSYIQRLATSGGLAPAGPCAAGDAPVEIPYQADYYFFVPAN